MLTLKNYQKRSLNELSKYFKEVILSKSSRLAFENQTNKPYFSIPQLPGIPYVCLRVPTGGGKTIMSAYSVNIAMKNLLHSDKSVVLWLVPTREIKDQTLEALRNSKHPYRKALEETIETPISILDTTEALFLQKNSLQNETVVIVSTLSALRIEDTDGRKIYDENGHLKVIFEEFNQNILSTLEKNSEGKVTYSLANVIKAKRPIVIMDEAHNARTNLSFETLSRFNPSCIIEYTATPRTTHNPENGEFASNVLCSVSAAELNAEQMIKLPIRLETRTDWKEVISFSLDRRTRLQSIANRLLHETGEYIRPIVLIQAQNNSQIRSTVNVDVILKSLIEDFRIPRDEIAIATGNQRELDGLNLFDDSCKINYIITVSALKEGWDCSFAYILCSVAELGSPTAVEQLIGRVLRLPNAQKKIYSELNKAYAYVSSQRFSDTVASLKDALVENGFERYEAESVIVNPEPELNLFNPEFFISEESIEEIPELTNLSQNVKDKITIDTSENKIKYSGLMTEEEKEELKSCFETESGKNAVDSIFEQTKKIPVFEFDEAITRSEIERQKVPFNVPYLAYKQGELFKIFEESIFINRLWEIADCDPKLTEEEFSTNSTQRIGQLGEIDVNDVGRVEAKFIEDLSEQVSLNLESNGWTIAELSNWLDRKIPHPDITYRQSSLFIYRVINYLIESRSYTLGTLIHFKYKLRDSIEKLIDKHRKQAKLQTFQDFLDLQVENIVVEDEFSFSFDQEIYPANWYYDGSYRFNKHYHELVGELKNQGEEFNCAVVIDQIPEVKHWIRNIDSNPNYSFWLQKSKGRFYPDFIAELNDGRIVVIEYKGDHLIYQPTEIEKKSIGELWDDRGGDKCKFIWATIDNVDNLRDLILNT